MPSFIASDNSSYSIPASMTGQVLTTQALRATMVDPAAAQRDCNNAPAGTTLSQPTAMVVVGSQVEITNNGQMHAMPRTGFGVISSLGAFLAFYNSQASANAFSAAGLLYGVHSSVKAGSIVA